MRGKKSVVLNTKFVGICYSNLRKPIRISEDDYIDWSNICVLKKGGPAVEG